MTELRHITVSIPREGAYFTGGTVFEALDLYRDVAQAGVDYLKWPSGSPAAEDNTEPPGSDGLEALLAEVGEDEYIWVNLMTNMRHLLAEKGSFTCETNGEWPDFLAHKKIIAIKDDEGHYLGVSSEIEQSWQIETVAKELGGISIPGTVAILLPDLPEVGDALLSNGLTEEEVLGIMMVDPPELVSPCIVAATLELMRRGTFNVPVGESSTLLHGQTALSYVTFADKVAEAVGAEVVFNELPGYMSSADVAASLEAVRELKF